MTQDAAKRAAECREQYVRALNAADTVWRSETDTVLNQDRLRYLQTQYVGIVFADYVDAAVVEAVKERDAEIARWAEHVDASVAEARRKERRLHAGAPPAGVGSLLHVSCPTCRIIETTSPPTPAEGGGT